MGQADNNYLSWFKDLDFRLEGRKGCHRLMSSNVYEPLDLLEKHIRQDWDELRRLQSYNNDWGHPVLKQRIADRYGVKPSEILLTNGCTNATYLSIVSHIRPGDTIICETPAYQPMWQTAKQLGARIKWLKRRSPHYGIDSDELAGLIDRKTALVALTNLHNPSGAHLTTNQLIDIAKVVRKKNKKARILVDEVFRDFVPDKPACKVDPIYISTGSLSKVYGLSHLECGWAMADKKTIDEITPCFVLSDGNGSRYLEALSAVVFDHFDEYSKRWQGIVVQNARELHRALDPLLAEGIMSGKIPEQGCIYFPAVAGVRNANALCERLAEEHKVYVVPGRFFGEPGRIRIGFGGRPEEFKGSIQKLAKAIRGIAGR